MSRGYALSGLDVYKYYASIKSHFTSKGYDFVKANGRLRNVNDTTYQKRTDRFFFEKLSKRYVKDNIVPYLVANFIANPDAWVGELSDNIDETNDIYLEYVKVRGNLLSYFTEDLKNIKQFSIDRDIPLQDLFVSVDGQHPIIFRFFYQKMIKIETFIILDDIIGLFNLYDKQLKDDFVWNDVYKLRLLKYKSFLSWNKEKYEKVTRELLYK